MTTYSVQIDTNRFLHVEGKTTGMSVASTILAQLGGSRFLAMTGARNMVGGDNYLAFNITGTKNKCNRVKITLTPDDLYTVSFLKTPRITTKALMSDGPLPSPTVIDEVEGIFADMLQSVFTTFTGLYTHL